MVKMKKRAVKKIALLAITAAMAVTAASCGSSSNSNGKIAIIAKAKGVQFWNYVKNGADDAGEELGYDITYSCPDDETQVDEQISMIKKAVSDRVKAIVIAPIDTSKLNDALRAADAAGIKVITIDSDVTYSGRKALISTNNSNAGAIAGRKAASILNNSGTVAIVGHTETSATAISRITGFKDSILKSSDKKISVVDTRYCDGDADKAKEQTKSIIQAHPDVKLIFGTNENSTLGICEAVDEMGKSGKIKIVGFNSNDSELNYIRSGTLTGTVIQAPYNMGYLGVRYSDKLLDGSNIPADIDTGATWVDLSNIGNSEIKLLLNLKS